MPHIEQSDLSSQKTSLVAQDITRHLYATQFLPGAAIIVAVDPSLLLSFARRNWLRRLDTLERHHAKVSLIAKMATVRFSRFPEDERNAEVFFIAPAQLDGWLPRCRAVYITCELDSDQLINVEKCVSGEGLIVKYSQ